MRSIYLFNIYGFSEPRGSVEIIEKHKNTKSSTFLLNVLARGVKYEVKTGKNLRDKINWRLDFKNN